MKIRDDERTATLERTKSCRRFPSANGKSQQANQQDSNAKRNSLKKKKGGGPRRNTQIVESQMKTKANSLVLLPQGRAIVSGEAN